VVKDLGEACWGEADPTEGNQLNGFIGDAFSYSFYVFNPGKMVLFPSFFHPGPSGETAVRWILKT